MRVAVIGAGGVGGYFGARLAVGGEEVHFIARGAHLEALKENGLQIHSASGDVMVKPALATSDAATVGPVDLVMIAVKLWSTEEAVRDAKPLVGSATAVVSFQNGVTAADVIEKAYGKEHTLGGVANIAALIERPGVVRHNGTMAILTIGELDGRLSDRVQMFLQACRRANIQARAADNIVKAIWEKYVALVSLSAMTALTRLPIGPLREDPGTRELMGQLMSEAVAVGRAKGVQLDQDTEDRLAQHMDRLPDDMVASMLGDLERGNRLELPWLSGGVVHMGRELGIPTPANAFIFAALKPYMNGRPAGARSQKV